MVLTLSLYWVSRWPFQRWHLAAFLPSCVVSGGADKVVQNGARGFTCVSWVVTQAGLSNANLFLTDKMSQVRDTTAALQAGRRHQRPHLFCFVFFSTVLPLFNACASWQFCCFMGFLRAVAHFWWFLPSSPWGGFPESLIPRSASLTATSLAFQNNTETTVLLEGGKVWELMSFFPTGWCLELTEQSKELRALGSSRNGGIREARKAVATLVIRLGAGLLFCRTW